ncbi:MAG: hypothetical protein U0L20_04185 [Ruminococcus sp.]|nr:hypothetical protein [Ruminococcus sp.]
MKRKSTLINSTYRIAFCGVISALSLTLMMLTAVFPLGTYAIPCIAGVIITTIVIEYGYKWATAVYIAVALLSLFFAADKEAVSYFILIFGYYPILKGIIEKNIKTRLVQYIFKFFVFNLAAVIAFYIGIFLLGVPAEEYTLFGFYIPLAFLAIGNIFFIIYDLFVTVFVIKYVRNLRKMLFRKK